jgi:hypothetical protein
MTDSTTYRREPFSFGFVFDYSAANKALHHNGNLHVIHTQDIHQVQGLKDHLIRFHFHIAAVLGLFPRHSAIEMTMMAIIEPDQLLRLMMIGIILVQHT